MAILDHAKHYTDSGVDLHSQNQSKRLSHDAWLGYRAALCYKLTDNPVFAKQSQQIIDAWAHTLQHIDSVQARNDINFDFPALVIASDWVQSANQWNDTAWRHLLTHNILPISQATTQRNNHANWGVLLNTAAAVYLKDPELLERSYRRWQQLLFDQTTAAGVYQREICRSDTNNYCDGPHKGIKGIAYTHYAMLPTTLTAQILSQQGKPVWTDKTRQRLQAVYTQSAIWTQQPSSFLYCARNNGHLIGVRNAAYFNILQRHYPNNKAGAAAIKQGNLGMDGFKMDVLFSVPPVMSDRHAGLGD